ncbi:MAG: 50S ribosomal protein L21 [Candidatus Brocadiia bacterium]
MYAILDHSGQQFKVEIDDEILVDRMEVPAGELTEFERVLMIGDQEDCKPRIGRPQVAGARVLVEVLRHERGPKVYTARYKGPHQTKIGHRQDYTRVKIREIHPE